MVELRKLKLKLKIDFKPDDEYLSCIRDLINNDAVKSMKNFKHHGNITCLGHSLYVSYYSYMMCKKLGLDYRSAARGGLLHDFYLYDWHINKPYKGLHGYKHPKIALKNANRYFSLNCKEKDIIKKHMWPLTLALPRYKESFVVVMVDKYCALREIIRFTDRDKVVKLKDALGF